MGSHSVRDGLADPKPALCLMARAGFFMLSNSEIS